MTTTKKKYEWPNREQWAENQRTCYYDLFDNLDLSEFRGLEDSQRDDAIKALRDIWKSEGVRMRAAKKTAGMLCKQPGETRRDYHARFFSMSDEEQNSLSVVNEPRWNREYINESIRLIRDKKWDWRMYSNDELPTWIPNDSEAYKIFRPILDRYKAAYKAAREKREQEILATPIDDEAWEKELQRRWSIDHSDPYETFIIRC